MPWRIWFRWASRVCSGWIVSHAERGRLHSLSFFDESIHCYTWAGVARRTKSAGVVRQQRASMLRYYRGNIQLWNALRIRILAGKALRKPSPRTYALILQEPNHRLKISYSGRKRYCRILLQFFNYFWTPIVRPALAAGEQERPRMAVFFRGKEVYLMIS